MFWPYSVHRKNILNDSNILYNTCMGMECGSTSFPPMIVKPLSERVFFSI